MTHEEQKALDIIQKATKEAEDIIEKARKEAEGLIEKARKDAETLVFKTKKEAWSHLKVLFWMIYCVSVLSLTAWGWVVVTLKIIK